MPRRWVVIRDPQGTFAPQPLLCTDLEATPEQVLGWFVQRWQPEVTFAAARRHLGVETQRPWPEPAVRRPTPARLGLFSPVTPLAHPPADARASVRRQLRRQAACCTSLRAVDVVEVPRAVVARLTKALCSAA